VNTNTDRKCGVTSEVAKVLLLTGPGVGSTGPKPQPAPVGGAYALRPEGEITGVAKLTLCETAFHVHPAV
jgi:hypothetical protein